MTGVEYLTTQALAEFSDGRSQPRLLSLLLPVQWAAEQCEWLRAMVASGEIYHPLRWRPADVYRFLSDVPKLAVDLLVRSLFRLGARSDAEYTGRNSVVAAACAQADVAPRTRTKAEVATTGLMAAVVERGNATDMPYLGASTSFGRSARAPSGTVPSSFDALLGTATCCRGRRPRASGQGMSPASGDIALLRRCNVRHNPLRQSSPILETLSPPG